MVAFNLVFGYSLCLGSMKFKADAPVEDVEIGLNESKENKILAAEFGFILFQEIIIHANSKPNENPR